MDNAQLEALLAPISPGLPGGTDAGYSLEFDEIRRLRKGDDDPGLSQGDWVRELRTPQWPRVRDLCERILKTQSKDLQAACWYTESLTQLEGFPGLSFGLKLLDGLLVRFGSGETGLFPLDPEERIAKLEWLNFELPMVIARLPMTSPKVGGHSFLKWEESRRVENLGARDIREKEMAITEGKLSGETWDKAASASGQSFFLRLLDQIQGTQESYRIFERRVDACFASEAPSLRGVSEAIEACATLTGQMLKRFGMDPGLQATVAPTLNLDASASPLVLPVLSGPIPSRADAIRRLREVAKYFRDHEPHSPVGPLVERAARWGEMPLGQWLTRVIKDESTLQQLQDLLDLRPEL